MLRQCYRASKPEMLFSTGMDAITTTHSAILSLVVMLARKGIKKTSCACLTGADSYKISSVMCCGRRGGSQAPGGFFFGCGVHDQPLHTATSVVRLDSFSVTAAVS